MFIGHVVNGEVRYGMWGGCPNGTPENKENCRVSVRSRYSMIPVQCNRKRGHGPDGLYCKQHAKIAERELAK